MTRKFVSLALFAAATFAAATFAIAQQPAIPIKSHEINADNTVTFRYMAPNAQKVLIGGDVFLTPQPMSKGADGIWTLTTKPLDPQYYSYNFNEDGVTKLDPFNPITVQNSDTLPAIYYLASKILIPGKPPMPWEMTAVPHGEVHHHLFTTKIVKDLGADQSGYTVYTPPNYDAKKKGGYPVLYLLHGWSDVETGWTNDGKANLILDNLIASGKAVPMIIVMPLGYGIEDFAKHPISIWGNKDLVAQNLTLFTQSFETEFMPAVEHEYNIAKGRDQHAIAGLSMGGLEALSIGLNHTDQFAYVAGMSSALTGGNNFDTLIPSVDSKKMNLKLLWVACGTDDGLIRANRAFVAWAKTKDLPVTPVETPGKHAMPVWRYNLAALAPILFQTK